MALLTEALPMAKAVLEVEDVAEEADMAAVVVVEEVALVAAVVEETVVTMPEHEIR